MLLRVRKRRFPVLRSHPLVVCIVLVPLLVPTAGLFAADKEGFVDSFDVKKENFASTGRNDYFILEPGFKATYEGKEDGKNARLVITVLQETKTVDGVETRVMEERETQDDQLVEVSRNFF